jgi:D-alanyl-D-alanine carboxypeptidase/D-alanyl-D-alanine-endopeptidase (penicillin-binding protein 4)
MIVSLTRGDTLFSMNPDAMMQPASTMKMYTSALALERFGPDYTFRTPVLKDGTVGPDGTLNGNLYLRGSGDPSLTQRFWHDQEPMDVLARQIAAAGIRRVRGAVIGDATAFDDQLIPEGWKTSYLGAAYAARVSALSLNENLVWVSVRPEGKRAVVTLEPATTSIPVESSVRVVGGSGGRISASRRSDGSITVRGTIGAKSGPLKYSLVADNPPLFAAGALQAALQKAGVIVDGPARLGQTPHGAVEVAALSSPPLAQVIGEMDRESINIFAELLFRAAGRPPNAQGTVETAEANLREFMARKAGTSANFIQVSDGSGLSLLDRVTPRSMVQLLSYAHRSDWSSAFHAALPVEGESGTLKRRSRGSPARGNLHAKTGTTNTVAALGGYVTAKNGEILAFSLIYNGADRGNAKAAMDQVGNAMAEFVRE